MVPLHSNSKSDQHLVAIIAMLRGQTLLYLPIAVVLKVGSPDRQQRHYLGLVGNADTLALPQI